MKNKLFITALSAIILSLVSALSPFSAQAKDVSQKGDVNLDGAFNISDVVLLQKWLLAVPNITLADPSAADFGDDGKVDTFDLCLMKKRLIQKGESGEKAQKTFLNKLYFVEIPNGYMVFDFCSDGTFWKYDVNADFGTIIYNSDVTSDYEIVGNRISFGALNTVFHKKTGTIVKLDGFNRFSVNFDDGEVLNFTTEPPTFKNKPIFMSGTQWIKHEDNSSFETAIEFEKDGVSGNYIIYPYDVTTTDAIKIPFTYEQYEYDIAFRMGSDDNIIMAKLLVSESKEVILAIEWAEGDTEYFHTTMDLWQN